MNNCNFQNEHGKWSFQENTRIICSKSLINVVKIHDLLYIQYILRDPTITINWPQYFLCNLYNKYIRLSAINAVFEMHMAN